MRLARLAIEKINLEDDHETTHRVLLSAVVLLVLAAGIHAQDLLVPAGTLLQCTMDEPNFSSATAAVGDPVLCHLKTMQEFGRPLFPRGSMPGGHLEAEKDPGHFVGKGYLKRSECTGTIVFPLPLPKQYLQKHLDCPSCGRRLWEDANDQTYASVSEFARALSNLKIHPFRTVVLGFTLIDKPCASPKLREG